MLQKFQNKYLRIIINAVWYITNDILHYDLNVRIYIRDEIKRLSQRYADRLNEHSNIYIYIFIKSTAVPVVN